MNNRTKIDKLVELQYESYPYPERDPLDEKRRLVTGSPSNLAEVNHYIFGGKMDLSKPLSVLVAGGGTGDGAIQMAQQMTDLSVPGQVMHLDLSESSQKIARKRASVRGLKNIYFERGSILDVKKILPGPWDYIDCCGVLHHLDDPQLGLNTLVEVLAPNGGIGAMVYGELGRFGVYHIQEMMRVIAPFGEEEALRVLLTKKLIKNLPETSWLNRNGQIQDHLEGGDPGIYDLFLHARDRAYTVKQIESLILEAKLRLVTFIEPYRYDPLILIKEPQLKKIINKLDYMERASFAEQLLGNFKKHIFYLVKKTNQVGKPTLDDASTIPVLVGVDTLEAAKQTPGGGVISVNNEGHKIDMCVPPLAKDIIELCDGNRDLDEIYSVICKRRSDLQWRDFKNQFDRLFRVMNSINRMVLRNIKA